MPLIKSVEAVNRQSPAIPRKSVALYHRNTNIRMRSDEREKLGITYNVNAVQSRKLTWQYLNPLNKSALITFSVSLLLRRFVFRKVEASDW